MAADEIDQNTFGHFDPLRGVGQGLRPNPFAYCCASRENNFACPPKPWRRRIELCSFFTELRTAWDAEVANDEAAINIEGKNVSLSLRTILGMSSNGPVIPRIEGHVRGRTILENLPLKAPGTAHNEMVEQFVTATFNPAILGQNWHQLHVMASVAERIVASHEDWRASLLS